MSVLSDRLPMELQPNGWMDDWVEFVKERRIGHMLRLVNNSSLNRLGDKLLPNLHKFFDGIEARLFYALTH